MTKPLKVIRKMRGRSVSELLARGGQAVSAYSDQIGLGSKLPTDAEFKKLVDQTQFGRSPIIGESLWQKFFKNADEQFFRSFVGETAANFRAAVGEDVCAKFIAKAELISEGRIDLLAYKDLFVGTEVDWHLEPVSGHRSPPVHWRQFDELDSSVTGDKKIVWELNRHQHFFTLGVAYILTGNEAYARVFAEHVESWIEQNPCGYGVNWVSSLEVSFRAMSWIWSLQFFRHSDALTVDLFKKMLKVLHQHGRHIERYLSKYYSPNTHLTGEALGLYYLGTQLPFMSRAKHWRKLGEDILLDEATCQIHSDGVYFEQSTWYQRYTIDFYSHFLTLRSLQKKQDYDKRNADVDSRYAAALEAMMYFTRPDGTTPMIGDDDGGRALPLAFDKPNDHRGSLALGSAVTGNGEFKFVAGDIVHEIFWLLGKAGVDYYRGLKSSEPIAPSRAFRDGGYMVMRDGWEATDNFMLVDCGEVGAMSGAHGHADALSIEAAVLGKTTLIDPGTFSYHESREMRDLFRETAAHNTITIDDVSSSQPGGVFSWRERATTTWHSAICEPRFDYFSGSVNGFSSIDGGAVHKREILFLRGDYMIIRDEVEARGNHAYELNFHYNVGISAGTSADSLSAGNGEHRVCVFADGGRWQQNESWVSSEYGRKTNAPLLRYITAGHGKQEFFTFILSTGRGGANASVQEVEIGGGRAFIIDHGDYHDVFVAGDGEMLSTELCETNFHFNWARLEKGSDKAEEYVLINGNRFTIDGDGVFEGDEIHHSATIRRLGSELYISSDGERGIVSL